MNGLVVIWNFPMTLLLRLICELFLLCTVHLLVVAVLLLLMLMDMSSEKVVLYTEMVIALDSVKLV